MWRPHKQWHPQNRLSTFSFFFDRSIFFPSSAFLLHPHVCRLLQASSVFEDDTENKAQTSNSHRNQSSVIVAANPSVLGERVSSGSGVAQKPLLLPVRILKSRFLDADETRKEPKMNEIMEICKDWIMRIWRRNLKWARKGFSKNEIHGLEKGFE
ncbi:hypothetical protein SLA2020_154960 [Shorea laevis]